jgi:hypothetical protein
MSQKLALTDRLSRCSESVRLLGYFCGADEATGMALVDPFQSLDTALAMQCSNRSARTRNSPRAFDLAVGAAPDKSTARPG